MCTVEPGHPLAPPSGLVAVARLTLWEKIGPGPHPCHWCKESVDWVNGRYAKGALIADHLNWDTADDSPGNLVPSCNACNGHRRREGGSTLIKPGELTRKTGKAETRAWVRYCNLCGNEFAAIPAEVFSGKARYCSRQCMYRRNRPNVDG